METLEVTRDEANLLLYLANKAKDEAQDYHARAEIRKSPFSNESDAVSLAFYENRINQCDEILCKLRGVLYE